MEEVLGGEVGQFLLLWFAFFGVMGQDNYDLVKDRPLSVEG
jgi:hypothetical protein